MLVPHKVSGAAQCLPGRGEGLSRKPELQPSALFQACQALLPQAGSQQVLLCMALTDLAALPLRARSSTAVPGAGEDRQSHANPTPQGLSVVLADRNYTVTGEEPHVQLSVRPGTLSLVVDISVPGRYNLTLIWNRHMTILIRITRDSQVPHALCVLPDPPRCRGGDGWHSPWARPDAAACRIPSAACVATSTGI